ncbi:sialate O-acetylesterase [Microbacterium sp. NPDC058062]|uniref:sialate O-acetylesterase n=1 Tax=Microbacterium sp. NPDC058062 TaxID=3346320 RepID=UPI0036DA84BA
MAINENVNPGQGGHSQHHRDLASKSNEHDEIITNGRLSEPELNATIDGAVEVAVPPLVEDALASSSTVQDAVDAAAAGLDFVVKTDPAIPEVRAEFNTSDWVGMDRDATGRVFQALGADGRRIIPGGIELGTSGIRVQEITSDEFGWAATFDPATRRAGQLVQDRNGLVPQAVLNEWAGRMAATPAAYPIDIVVVAGQSNATERSSLPETVSDVDSRVLQWDATLGAYSTVAAAAVPWIGNEFAREYVQRVPGRRVLIVPTAMGSTGFTETSNEGQTWSWSRTNTTANVNLYNRMISRTQAALAAAGVGARIVAVLWSQGESDRGAMTQSQYATALDDLIAQARIDLGDSKLPFIIGSMTPETIWDGGAGTIAINAALLDTPRRVQRTSYVWGPPNMQEYLNSRIHWSPQGQAQRARVMAASGLLRARLNVATSTPVPPQNVRVSRSGTAVSIEWDAPPCRVTAYAVEVSTNSGSSWTSLTLDGPIITLAATTATATDPVWVRARTTNEVGTSDWTREVRV